MDRLIENINEEVKGHKSEIRSQRRKKNMKHNYWLTPPDLMKQLDAEFHFDFDPCPYPRPKDFNGLDIEWGQSNYVNPPFIGGKGNGPTAWARKSIIEFQKGKTVVMVFPIDKWILRLLDVASEIRNLCDVRWCSVEDGSPGKGVGRWVACFILKGETYGKKSSK